MEIQFVSMLFLVARRADGQPPCLVLLVRMCFRENGQLCCTFKGCKICCLRICPHKIFSCAARRAFPFLFWFHAFRTEAVGFVRRASLGVRSTSWVYFVLVRSLFGLRVDLHTRRRAVCNVQLRPPLFLFAFALFACMILLSL